MNVTERLLKYVAIHTASDENSNSVPSSGIQMDLSNVLAEEMHEIGMTGIYVDEHAYVYGEIPATDDCKDLKAIAFIAHLDTIPDFCGENVKPQVIRNYDGSDVVLGTSGRVLETEKFPDLKQLLGQTLITTDGTTVLGADDKAGIAEIMDACEKIILSGVSHRKIAVCFTPDEEIGHGADLMDIDRLNVDFGFTVDGGETDEINFETFNAAAAKWTVNGFNVHPGSAKNTMVNSCLVAMEINSMLPSFEIPSNTENYEGFFHLTNIEGSVEKTVMYYIIRDHDASGFDNRKKLMRMIEKNINEKYGSSTAILEMKDQYYNMADLISKRPEIIEVARKAIEKENLIPSNPPIRGGTDGSHLSYRGLLCPNLGTGGYAFHGPYEHITSEKMEQVSRIIQNIILSELC